MPACASALTPPPLHTPRPAGNIGTSATTLWASTAQTSPWVRLAFDNPVSDNVTVLMW
jgi:hypothetical protein